MSENPFKKSDKSPEASNIGRVSARIITRLGKFRKYERLPPNADKETRQMTYRSIPKRYMMNPPYNLTI
jgi:hypothetical protein